MFNLTGPKAKKLTNKPGLVVEIAILAVQKSISTGHTLHYDCDIQICESEFQRTVNQTVMYR